HLSVIEARNEKLGEVLEKYNYVNIFIVKILNHVFSKEIFNFNFTGADYRFDREIILLPCLEVGEGEDFIWEDDGKHYTLAVVYIKKLMDEAKELREKKTIRLYEAERAKYEAERAKYEAGYKRERVSLVWKKFTLDNLFNFDSGNQLSMNKKALEVSSTKDDQFKIALITQSEKNNGISGYLEETEEIKDKKMNNYLTYSMHFGLCFYHNYDFVLMDTHGSVFRLLPKENKLGELMKQHEELNYFLGKSITKICRNGIYNYSWLPNSSRVGREIILLPCLEVGEGEDFIWEDDGKHYTLAIDYISYIYLTGKVNYNQKRIDNYTYQY
ncbi:MAG: hypothetical protein K6E99_01595, partial [Bacilli bacterium]|nr:hypothetical protein [Bacilli bacterium]